ncbi:MAG: hypothetical protein AAFU71_11525 [Cyanobacteria bacterium J06632_22]
MPRPFPPRLQSPTGQPHPPAPPLTLAMLATSGTLSPYDIGQMVGSLLRLSTCSLGFYTLLFNSD